MVDWSLVITIALIFLVTLIGAYLRFRQKDACLKSFAGFDVTLVRASGKTIWGQLVVESTGLELLYRDQVQDEKHIESSYVLYASEYADIQALYRYADELSDTLRNRRSVDIERSFHPGPRRRLMRSLRNFVGTASASLGEVIGILIGRMRKIEGQLINDKSEAYLNRLSGTLLGQAGAVYDPILERYIGQRVVVEVVENSEVHEHVGTFKDYSADFIQVLDVRYPYQKAIVLTADGRLATSNVGMQTVNDTLMVENCGGQPLLLQSLRKDDHEQLLNVVVDAGETVELHPGPDYVGAQLHMQVVRELDMIVPRNHCVIRHRAEYYRPESLPQAVFDIIFDVGIALSGDKRIKERETRLRAELKQKPDDALAAANLGAVLIQKQEFEEAEKLLRMALALDNSLPDGGRRARMQLREIQRHRTPLAIEKPNRQENF